MKRIQFIVITLLFTWLGARDTRAQGTAFTYQGRVMDGSNPAHGIYDLRFTIYDALTGGNVVGGPLTNAATSVSPDTSGFVVTLDFGGGVFDGSARWLDIGVRTNGTASDFTSLKPRQQITSTPYAVRALAAGSAASYTGAILDSQLSGNIARLNGSNVFSGPVQLNNSNNTLNGFTTITNLTAPGAVLSNANLHGFISITNLAQFTNAGTLLVRQDGNDATAMRGRFDKPWASVSNAVWAARSGDTVLIGPGTFTNNAPFSQTVGAINVFFKTNLAIRGSGPGTVLFFPNQGNGFMVTSNRNITIRDLTLQGIQLSSTVVTNSFQCAIRVEVTHDSLLEDLRVMDWPNHGIAFIDDQVGFFPQPTNNIVRRCSFSDIGKYIATFGNNDGTCVVPASWWLVEDCDFESSYRAVEPYDVNNPIIGFKMKNCRVKDMLENGFTAAGSPGGFQDTVISGNHFELNKFYVRPSDGSNTYSSAYHLVINCPATNTIISDNTFVGGPSFAILNGGRQNGMYIRENNFWGVLGGIRMSSETGHPQDIVIADNTFHKLGGNAIEMVGGSNVFLLNNTMKNLGTNGAGYGVIFYNDASGPTNIVAHGNIIYNTSQFPSHLVNGFYFDSGIKGIRLWDNLVWGQTGAAINNLAGSQLYYDDTAKTLNGTNFVRSLVTTNGVWLLANTPPAAAIVAGASFLWNSNGVATYLLTSSPGSTAWVQTNKLGGP